MVPIGNGVGRFLWWGGEECILIRVSRGTESQLREKRVRKSRVMRGSRQPHRGSTCQAPFASMVSRGAREVSTNNERRKSDSLYQQSRLYKTPRGMPRQRKGKRKAKKGPGLRRKARLPSSCRGKRWKKTEFQTGRKRNCI